MEEWPDDHLDELFRKSAEEFDAPFNADDWTDMSRRLDKHDRQTLFDRISRWGGITALLLLLLGGLGWVMYDKESTGNHQQAIITVLTPAKKSIANPAETGQSGKRDLPRNEGQSGAVTTDSVPEAQSAGVTTGPTKQPGAVNTIDPAGQSTTKNTDSQPTEAADPTTNRSPGVAAANAAYAQLATRGHRSVRMTRQTSGQPTRQVVQKRNRPVATTDVEDSRSVAGNSVNRPAGNAGVSPRGTYLAPTGNVPGNRQESQPAMAIQLTDPALPTADEQLLADRQWLPALTPATSLSSVVQQVRPAIEPTPPQVTVSTPITRAMPRLTGLSILLFASPDLSSIGLKNFDRPGSNAGLAIQYQLTDRLSINAGAMYSTKRYQTNASEYVWPDNWAKDIWPEGITGNCTMIDISLNVRYDWLLRPRGDGKAPARWFASTGLTSYFIKHEVYNYEYANPADPRINYWGWDNQKAGMGGGSFGFSNLNISIGYERPITNRLSWQIEPFMKVPLKQVGYFKIRLLSTGAFVGLRYRL